MWRLAGLLVLCALAGDALAQGSPQPEIAPIGAEILPTDKKGTHEAQAERPAEPPKAVSAPAAPIVASDDKFGAIQNTNEAASEQKNWWKSFFSEVKITDIAISFFTLALVVYTARLNSSTLKLWETAQEQSADTKIATAAGRLSAEAAERSAKAAETALLGIDRPYVFIARPVVYLFARERCRYPHAEYYIRNFGRTPAIVRKRVYGLLFCRTIPEAPPYEAAVRDPDWTAIAADSEILGEAAQSDRILEDDEVERARANALQTLFFGRIEYEDTFGNSFVTGFGYVRKPYDGRYASNEILIACEHPGYNYHRKVET